MLTKAVTFDPTIGFSISLVFWKLDIQSFPRTPIAFKYAIKVKTKKREKDKIADVSQVDPAYLVATGLTWHTYKVRRA